MLSQSCLLFFSFEFFPFPSWSSSRVPVFLRRPSLVYNPSSLDLLRDSSIVQDIMTHISAEETNVASAHWHSTSVAEHDDSPTAAIRHFRAHDGSCARASAAAAAELDVDDDDDDDAEELSAAIPCPLKKATTTNNTNTRIEAHMFAVPGVVSLLGN